MVKILLSSVIIVGGQCALTGLIWAWAVGASLSFGTMVGGAIGAGVGFSMGMAAGAFRSRAGGHDSAPGAGCVMAGTGCGCGIFMLPVGFIGLFVGIIRALVSLF